MDNRPDDRILGTVVLVLGTLGGVGLGRGGGSGGGGLGGGLVGLGAEMAFVGRAVVVVVGGGGLFVTGDRRVVALRVGLEGELFLSFF